ncbi:MAG: imidazole glycerol phosphate synthase [Anaerocolumna sp.]|jgi:glutamine amidotransferase|nr:imidazole glycerol phosphate synthase [Anaerocolumna sp.]
MVSIIDYGMGNIQSLSNSLRYLDIQYQIINEPQAIIDSAKLILPGVGSFRKAMQNLTETGIRDALHEAVLIKQIPILGICLGMQMLAEESTEDGKTAGLGWVKGKVEHFSVDETNIKIPHIGFNSVSVACNNSVLFSGIPDLSDFYFIHSYRMQCDLNDDIAGTCQYGTVFTAAIERNNIFGTQFHPEKSQLNGLTVLRSFVKWRG